MVTMADHHIPRPCIGAVFVLCVSFIITYVSGQGTNNEAIIGPGPADTKLPQKDTLEETVFAEMLRVVDHKFDSLSARISVLERSVNSLNFYSVRQFRDIAEHMEASKVATDNFRSQINKMEKDSRALKSAVSQTGRDVNVIKSDVSVIRTDVSSVKTHVGVTKTDLDMLKSDSLKMFDDIANSIVYFNENVEEKTDTLKAMMKEAMATITDNDLSDGSEDTAMIIKYLEDLDFRRPRNCTVNFRPLEERIDLRFAEMKRQTHIHFVDLINAGASSDSEEEEESEESEEEESEEEEEKRRDTDTDAPEALRQVSQENSEAAGEGERRKTGGRRGRGEGQREGEKVMKLLANMTQNVMEAVSYFRHTGGMMETLLHTTQTMAEEQSRLRYDVLEASRLLSSNHMEGAEVLFEEMVNNVPEGGDIANNVSELDEESSEMDSVEEKNNNLVERTENGVEKGSKLRAVAVNKNHLGHRPPSQYGYILGGRGASPASSSPSSSGEGMREVAEESLRVLSELTKNGTQMLDVLTDLAQLSSNTLTKAVGALHAEVVRLEDVGARLNDGLLLPAKAPGDVTVSQDKSTEMATGGDLRSLQNTTKTIFSIVEAIASNTGWIPYIFHNMQHVERLTNRTLELAKRSLLSMHWNRPHGNEIPGPLAQERQLQGQTAISQAQALDAIYNTNIRLQRIMPALTKLLAEPEPLVALAEGRNSQEGRAEIFYRGQWGSVCRLDMGHSEASALCKHLGYAGGVWAGADEFGPGDSGRFWILNVTCLYTELCPLVVNVNHTVDCPSGHFSVVCDHMLRMTPIPGINDAKTGLVSVHHRGRWTPVCSHGWSGYEARVACKQMGYLDGREFLQDDMRWRQVLGEVSTWVSGVGCTGEEVRLDSCKVDSFTAKECAESDTPAAVRCQ